MFRGRGRWVGFLDAEAASPEEGWQELEFPLELEPPRWLVVASHRGGSLSAVMARARAQNLAIGGL
jgi:hypothetical protein